MVKHMCRGLFGGRKAGRLGIYVVKFISKFTVIFFHWLFHWRLQPFRVNVGRW